MEFLTSVKRPNFLQEKFKGLTHHPLKLRAKSFLAGTNSLDSLKKYRHLRKKDYSTSIIWAMIFNESFKYSLLEFMWKVNI